MLVNKKKKSRPYTRYAEDFCRITSISKINEYDVKFWQELADWKGKIAITYILSE